MLAMLCRLMIGQIIWLDQMDFGTMVKTLPLIKLLNFLRMQAARYHGRGADHQRFGQICVLGRSYIYRSYHG
ncbi:hypothetical protein ACLOJK_014795 [Asimina triloba]